MPLRLSCAIITACPMIEKVKEELIRDISDGLSWPDSPDFDRAIDILRELPDSQYREIFESLLNDPPAGLALGVAQAVGILECRDALDLKLALAEEPGKWFSHEERAAVRLAAVRSLGVLREPSAVGILFDLIAPGGDTELPMEVVQSIARIGSADSITPLIEKMNDNPPIALSAAGAIAEIGGEEAFTGLVDGLKHEDEYIRSASIWALGKMGDERAIDSLLTIMRECDAFLRADIAWSLGQIGGIRARQLLEALCQNDADLGVRREAAKAILQGAVLGQGSEQPE